MKVSKRKIDIALARKHWNQRDLRDNGAVSAQTILNLNKGKSVLPATVVKIASSLGLDVTEIIDDEG